MQLRPVYCHLDFLDAVEDQTGAVSKRASYILERLTTRDAEPLSKATQGLNRGWLRSPLGGNDGSHYYLWWAPNGTPAVSSLTKALSGPAAFVRAIRHHDDHRALFSGVLGDYVEYSRAATQQEALPTPWTEEQQRFIVDQSRVRLIKGFAGSGKTAALIEAASRLDTESTLYITFSPRLVAIAKAKLDAFGQGRRCRLISIADFYSSILGEPAISDADLAEKRFLKALTSLPTRLLGPWHRDPHLLYAELHAHMLGWYEPDPMNNSYYRRRSTEVGTDAAAAALNAAVALRDREDGDLERRFFPLLWQAKRAVACFLSGTLELPRFDCFVVDEVQDFTHLETVCLAKAMQGASSGSLRPLNVLMAGDECQTIRSTGFDWGWFTSIISNMIAPPVEYQLTVPLRSPTRLCSVVTGTDHLYKQLSKQHRPGLSCSGSAQYWPSQVTYCVLDRPGLDSLLNRMRLSESAVTLSLGAAIECEGVLPIAEAKGLEFQTVCLLGISKALQQANPGGDREPYGIELLAQRTAIDALRIALSRALERLVLLDVGECTGAFDAVASALGAGCRVRRLRPDDLETVIFARPDESARSAAESFYETGLRLSDRGLALAKYEAALALLDLDDASGAECELRKKVCLGAIDAICACRVAKSTPRILARYGAEGGNREVEKIGLLLDAWPDDPEPEWVKESISTLVENWRRSHAKISAQVDHYIDLSVREILRWYGKALNGKALTQLASDLDSFGEDRCASFIRSYAARSNTQIGRELEVAERADERTLAATIIHVGRLMEQLRIIPGSVQDFALLEDLAQLSAENVVLHFRRCAKAGEAPRQMLADYLTFLRDYLGPDLKRHADPFRSSNAFGQSEPENDS